MIYVAVLSALFALTAGSYFKPCRTDIDCGKNLGLTCQYTYEKCKMGSCHCAKGLLWDFTSKRCMKLKKIGDVCDAKEHYCAPGSDCTKGTCKCIDGSPTSDNYACRALEERFVGEECDLSKDHQCIVYAMGLKVASGVACTKGVCNCTAHTKARGRICLSLAVGDKGCTTKCPGTAGSTCIDGECRCEKGKVYHEARHTCISAKAERGVAEGGDCNEYTSDGLFCATGLVCAKCPGEALSQSNTCIRLADMNVPFIAKQIIDGNNPASKAAGGAIFLWAVVLVVTLIGI